MYLFTLLSLYFTKKEGAGADAVKEDEIPECGEPPKLLETSNKDVMEHNEVEKRYRQYCLYTPMVFSNSVSF